MNDLKIVKNILSQQYHLSENPTFIFGSRSNGTHRPDSDLDILIEDTNLKPETVTLLEEQFEASSLTYKIDLVLKSRIDADFYNKIQPSLKSIDHFGSN